MIPNGTNFELEERKSDHFSDDSFEINVEAPKKQMTTHTDFDIKYEEDDKKIAIYIELNPKTVLNLTKEANKGMVFEEDDRRRYKNCIFIRKIQTPDTQLKGNFRVHFLHYKGLTFCMQFMKTNIESQMPEIHSKMKVHYKSLGKWETKWLQSEKKEDFESLELTFQIGASEVDKILKQSLLLEVYFDKYTKSCKDYVGILNQGNTCYANSTMQMLFHFVPLRKLIMEVPSKKLKKLTKCLQEIFVDMMTAGSAIRADQLLKWFQKKDSSNSAHNQQDIHEFLMSLIEELETQLPQVAQIWTGRDYQFTFSKEVNYQSKQQQNFTELQLFMKDNKGTNLKSVEESLKHLLQEDLADEPIETDNFGRIKVYKSREFETLPPLLLLNIKRYKYNPKRRQLKKINIDMQYPKQLNLDFMLKTNQGLDYILYSVVVHKGRTPNSGHYFCLVNLAKSVDKPDWYEFNDSNVRKIKEEKVLNNFTGKKRREVYIDEYYGKWAEREEISEQTAYLLIYINKDLFEKYQNMEVKIPTWQIQRLQEKLTLEQSKTMVSVRLSVLGSDPEFRPFDQSYQLQEFKLCKDQEMEPEVKKHEKVLSVKIGTIWKVNCKTQTIKHIHKKYGPQCRITVGKHTQQKQSIRQPDYFLIVPQQKMKQAGDYEHKKLGILHIEHQTQTGINQKVLILSKDEISEKLAQLKKSGHNVEWDDDKLQIFSYGWNSYLNVKIS